MADRAALGILHGVQFGVHATLFAANQPAPVVAAPFFNRRLEAVRCALMYVAPIITAFGEPAAEARQYIIRAKRPLSLYHLQRL